MAISMVLISILLLEFCGSCLSPLCPTVSPLLAKRRQVHPFQRRRKLPKTLTYSKSLDLYETSAAVVRVFDAI